MVVPFIDIIAVVEAAGRRKIPQVFLFGADSSALGRLPAGAGNGRKRQH
jgi:hypothetical protein